MKENAMRRVTPWILVIGLTNVVTSCASDHQEGSRVDTESEGAPPLNIHGGSPSGNLRADAYVLRSLTREAPRAELWTQGLFIDLGTADQHKFLRGGWQSGWKSGADTNGKFARPERTAKVRIHIAHGGTQAILVRARSSKANQKLTLYVDKRPVASRSIKPEWNTQVFPLPRPLASGRYTLTLAFSQGDKTDARAEVDWIWLAQRKDASEPGNTVKVASRSFDKTMTALVADAPRQLSFYLHVPRESELVFDYGAKAETAFQVDVQPERGEKKTEFRGQTGDGRWHQGRVDLKRWSGQLVRIDFKSTGETSEAGWGEPNLVRRGKKPVVPPITGAERAENVIQILIDTVRQDAFKAFNPNTRVSTPAMDKFVKGAVRFPNAYVQGPWTKPSIATMFSGLYPSTHDTQSQSAVLPKEVLFLSEHVRKSGLKTAAFIANGWVSAKFGFEKGWDTYRNYIREERVSKAESVYNDAIAWLKKNASKGRFYLYVHTIDPHVPYKVAEKYREPYYKAVYKGKLGSSITGQEALKMSEGKLKVTETDKRWIRALYDGEISYHDEHFGRFLATLKQMGLFENSVVVVSNDHGEEQFDHGAIGHGHSLYDELIRSPLIFHYPRFLPTDRAIETTVGLIDLTPTLLDLLALPPMPGMEGQSLIPTIFDAPPHALDYEVAEFRKVQRSVRIGDYKLIATRSGSRLFDLKSDAGEQHDVADTHLLAHRTCEIYLAEALALKSKWHRLPRAGYSGSTQGKRFKASDVKLDPRLKKQLEALGYIN